MAKYENFDFLYGKDLQAISDAHSGIGILNGVEITPGSGLSINVSSGTALFGETEITVPGETDISLTNSSSEPRKDTVSIDNGGNVIVTTGVPGTTDPSGNIGRKTFSPVAPDTPQGNILIGELYIPANATSLSSTEIFDLKQIIVGTSSQNLNPGNGIDITNEVISVVESDLDHTNLTGTGTNSHTDIDNHIADTSTHFTQGDISITENQISDLGNYALRSELYSSSRNIYVSASDGDDTNGDGESFATAYASIEKAIEKINTLRQGVPSFMQYPISINLESGKYYENNPLTVPRLVSINGTDLRTTRLYANNPKLDYFHCNDLTYFTNLRFYYLQAPSFAFAFPCSLAQPTLLNGNVDSVTILYTRSGYTTAPEIVVDAPEDENGTTAQMTAVISGGEITSITIDDPGSGYTIPPSISIPAPKDQQAFIAASPYPLNCSSITGPFLRDGRLLPVTMPLPYDESNPGFNPVDQVTYDSPVDEYGAGGGIRIDGRACFGWNNLSENDPFIPASPLKSFVTAQFTQVNQGGPGHLLTNEGFAQFVSSFTTFCNQGFRAVNGAFALLSNSVSDFGLEGLIAEGKSLTPYTQATLVNSFTSSVGSIKINSGGSGYSSSPTISISGGGGTGATATATVENGEIISVIVDNSGSGYTSVPSISVSDGTGTGADLEIILNANTDITIENLSTRTSAGQTVTLNPQVGTLLEYAGQDYKIVNWTDNLDGTYDVIVTPGIITGTAAEGVDFVKNSVLNTGGHIFEYSGTGVTYNALPEYGGIPDGEKQVIERTQGRVFHTSSDEQGNFKVGKLFRVDQNTGEVTISTDRFNLSGLNAIGPFKFNGLPVGVQLREISDRNDLESSSGLNSNTVPTVSAVKTYFEGGNKLIPIGGLTNQVLKKLSSNDRDLTWDYIDESEIQNLDKYTQTEVNNLLDEKIEGVGTNKVTVSETEPTTPSVGDIWIELPPSGGGN